MLRSPTHRFVAIAALFTAAFAISCGSDMTGPSRGGVRYARGLSFQPVFPALAAQAAGEGLVPFTTVHIVLRHADGTIALDTVVNFPEDATELTLTFDVALSASAPLTGEPLFLNLAYINAAGEIVFEGGPISIIAVPSVAGAPPPPPVSIPVSYTGPGSTAASVVITPHASSVFAGDAFVFTAQAFDASGAVMPGTPIVFSSSNPALAPLTSASSGSGTAAVGRGAVTITAQLLTGPSDAATLTVQPRPSAIALVSGSGQTSQVNTTLPLPAIVRVTASDGLGVGGVNVSFTPSGDGLAEPPSGVTAADGTVQTTWTLGSTAETHTLLATAAGLTGSPVTITAIATPKPPAKLVVITQPINAQVNASVGNVTIAVQDGSGNVATTFSGTVSIALGANPGAATLAGTTTVNAVTGIATFSTLSLNVIASGYTLVASSAGLTPATSSSFDILSGPATRVEFSTQPVSAVAGVVLAPVQVTVRDVSGNVATSFTGPVQISISSNPGGSTLSGPTTVNAVAGVATFSTLSLNKSGIDYTLLAGGTGLGAEVSTPFTITAAAPATCTVASGNNQTAPAGATISVVIAVQDAFGNGVPGSGVNGTVTLGGGTLSPASNTADAGGSATFAWTLGPTVGAQSFSATCAGVAASVAVNATATSAGPGPATQLVFAVQPSNATAGLVGPAVVVHAKDAFGTTDTTYTAAVTIAIGANPGTSTLGGTLTVAAVAGVATFSNLKLNKSGVGYTLTAASGALTGATSTAFNITPAPAITMVKLGGDAQTANTGTLLPTPIKVTVTDSLGNAVPGVTVNWAAVTGGGSVSAATSLTQPNGDAFINWTLGATVGAQTATATAAGLAGSPATFTATGTIVGFSKTWNGSVSTAWAVAGNWTPSGVPIAGDGVFIPVTANNPVLSASISLVDLSIAPTASLTLGAFDVNLTGNLDAGTTIVGGGAGAVFLNGTGTVKGVITSSVTVGGNYTVSGALSVTGTLNISGPGITLDIGANAVTVTGPFMTTVGGLLKMTNAAGTISVSGNATFNGQNESGLMTAGTFTLGGNLIGTSGLYNGSGTNTIRFNGAALQTITGNSYNFKHMDFAGPGGVNIANGSGFSINGDVTVQPASGNITGAVQLYLNSGSLSEPSGGGKWLVDSLSFGGCSCVVTLPANIHGILRGMGNVTLGNKFTVDSMEIYSGGINWGEQAVLVLGDFRTTGNGTFGMTALAESLTVNGNATFGGFSTNLTNGWTTFNGNFAQTAAFNASSFRGSPGHRTRLAGGANQTISFATPDTNATAASCGSSCLGELWISKTGGSVTFLTSAKFAGAMFVNTPGTTSVDAIGATGSPKFIVVAGDIQNLASIPMHLTRASLRGGLSIGSSTTIDSIVFAGVAQVFGARTWNHVTVLGSAALVGNLTVQQALVIGGTGTLTVQGFKIFDNGSFATTGAGRLIMDNPSDSVVVFGPIVMGGGATAPSAGTIVAQGDFTATGATFQASGSNTLFMSDTTAESGQTLTYTAPVGGQGIRHLLFDGPRAKTVVGNVTVMGDLSIGSNSNRVNGPGATVRIGGNFSDSTAFPDTLGAWVVQNTELFGSPTISADYITTNLSIMGGTAQLPYYNGAALRAGLVAAPQRSATARPGAGAKSSLLARSMGSYFVQVNGSVIVSGASAVLDLNGNSFYVMADFGTASGGKLLMTDPFEYLFVAGSATFAGGSTAGMLTMGQLRVLADFTQGGGAADAFSADPGFETDIGFSTAFCECAIRAGLRSTKVREAQSKNPELAAARQTAADRSRRMAAARAARRPQHTERAQRLAALGVKVTPDSLLKPFRRAGAPARAVRGIRLASIGDQTSIVSIANSGLGAGVSHFGDLYVTADIMVLAGDIHVAGELESGFSSGHTIVSSNNAITSRGSAHDYLVFDNTRWVLLDGASFDFADYTTFINMDPTVDQFTVQRDGTSGVYLYYWDFETIPTTGHYISATDTDGPGTGPLFVYVYQPFPGTHGGFLELLNGATSNWASTFVWTGLGGTSYWSDGGNWSTGFAPYASDDVTIPAGTPHDPLLNYNGYVHSLTIDAGASIDLGCSLSWTLFVYGNLLAPTATNSIPPCEGEGITLIGDGGVNTVTGYFGVAYVNGNYNVAGQLIVSDQLTINGNLTVSGGRVDVGGVGGLGYGSFYTLGSGTLTMNNPADQMFVGSGGANFEGGSTTGLLTAGTLTLVNGFVHTVFGLGALDAFAASGTHTTVFAGVSSNVQFGSVSSFLQNAEIPGTSVMALSGGYVQVKGTLSHTGSGTAIVDAGGTTVGLSVTGLNNSTQPLIIRNVLLTFFDGTPNVTFDNVFWELYPVAFTGNAFAVNRSDAGTLTFTGHDFSTINLGSGGHFLVNLGTANVHMASPNPGTVLPGLQILQIGLGTIIWP